MPTRPEPPPRARAARVETVLRRDGAQIWLIEDRRNPIVSVSFAWKGGAAQEPAGRAGATAMLADLLTEGAGDLAGPAFRQALADHAIGLSFSAERDALRGRLRTLSQHTDRAFELLTLAVTRAQLAADAVDRIRDAHLAALRANENNPRAVAGRLFQGASFPGHPYGRPVPGYRDTIAAVARDDLDGLRMRLLAQDTFRIAIVGDINAAAVARAVDRMLAALRPVADLVPVAAPAFAGVGTRQVTAIDLPQSAICFGRPGIPRSDPDFMAAAVVEHCLGSSPLTSRLFREVREKRGLCYAIGTQNVAFDHAAMLVGSLSTRNDRVGEALDVIRAEMRRMAEGGLSAAELADARTYLTGSYDLRFDTTTTIAGHLCDLQCAGDGPDWLDGRNAAVEAVTPADAARAAARLCGDGAALVTIAGRPVEP